MILGEMNIEYKRIRMKTSVSDGIEMVQRLLYWCITKWRFFRIIQFDKGLRNSIASLSYAIAAYVCVSEKKMEWNPEVWSVSSQKKMFCSVK